MTNEKCETCVYFIGKKSLDPRWEWSHCKVGVTNITKDFGKFCEDYANTIQMAIKKNSLKFKKRMGWDKCPYCGGSVIE